jgi:hypothetical protein
MLYISNFQKAPLEANISSQRSVSSSSKRKNLFFPFGGHLAILDPDPLALLSSDIILIHNTAQNLKLTCQVLAKRKPAVETVFSLKILIYYTPNDHKRSKVKIVVLAAQ